MLEPYAPSKGEMQNLIYFLSRSLRPHVEWSIDKEYPFVFNNENRENMRIISSENEILSHAAIRPLWIRTPMGLFKVAALGSVVTHEDHRLQGFSQKVITSCLEKAQRESYDFAILWTEIYDFYRPLDFELAGYEISFIIEKEFEAPKPSPPLRFMQTNKIAPEAILKLYSKHSVYSLRKIEEVKKYLEIPNTQVFTAWDTFHQLQAYAVTGKGTDLENYIHEWGGGISAILPLISYVRKKRGKPITLISPFYSQNLIRNLNLHKEEIIRHDGFLGMIRLLDIENFFSKIKKYAQSIGVSDFLFQKKEDTYCLHENGKTFKTKSLKELTQFIFGSPQMKPKILHPENSNEKTLFPLFMWIWGWDSV